MNTNRFTLAFISLAASLAMPLPVAAHDEDHGAMVTIRDDCDPTDPGWAPTGGCLRKQGDVNLAEFNFELSSPLSSAVIGHQAWRMDPPYLKIDTDDNVTIRNRGGRTHTFTEVQNYGGGRVPPLAKGLIEAPECVQAINIPAGGKAEVHGLAEGNHHFQCCIHPWMRALIKVQRED
ncbi:MAG TPA: hypothetical protein VLI89_12755 [Burkholderiales bacterium]|jgi:plastocyanin|nr:hypothetical protein [Burkholderiales bacterium]